MTVSSSISPVRASTNSPFLNARTLGMLRIPYFAGVRRFVSSISNFTKFTSLIFSETDSKIGPNIRHGPHQDAQKSTNVMPLPIVFANVSSFACVKAIFFSLVVDIRPKCIIIGKKCKRKHKMNKIIYLDAAASALKPSAVIEAEANFMANLYANTGRGVCARAAAADDMLNAARAAVANFIGADTHQVIFTSGTTDGMNRIVNIVRGTRDVKIIAVSDIDHHSARMPWENVVRNGNAKLVKIPLDKNYNIDCANMPVADVVVITAMSNVFGIAQDVKSIINAARNQNPNVITIVDAAQYVAHSPIDVRAWDCDFMCFSGHKIGANTGVGVMYIKNPDLYSPDKLGGGMVQSISGDNWNFDVSPNKFEAGTLPLTQIAGLPAAINAWRAWNGGADIISYIYDELSKMPRVKLLTMRDAKIISFIVDEMHVLDFGAMIGVHNVCVRVGNMCASWAHAAMGIMGSIRISVGPWNTIDDARSVVDIIRGIVE